MVVTEKSKEKCFNLLNRWIKIWPHSSPSVEVNRKLEDKNLEGMYQETKDLIDHYSSEIEKCNSEIAQVLNKIDKNIITSDNHKSLREIRRCLMRNIESDDYWEKIILPFENLDPKFIARLYQINSNLTMKEVKHCAYLMLGMDVEELANLEGISVKSVKMARYRIKKRLKGNKEQPLEELLSDLKWKQIA